MHSIYTYNFNQNQNFIKSIVRILYAFANQPSLIIHVKYLRN